MRMRAMATALTLLGLAGCVTPPDLSQQDVGPEPTNHEAVVDGFLQRSLRDPETARIDFLSGPRPIQEMYLVTPAVGWAVCYSVNARNAYGGYTGATTHMFVIRHGLVVAHLAADGQYGTRDRWVWARC
jgi:hypothetical protein